MTYQPKSGTRVQYRDDEGRWQPSARWIDSFDFVGFEDGAAVVRSFFGNRLTLPEGATLRRDRRSAERLEQGRQQFAWYKERRASFNLSTGEITVKCCDCVDGFHGDCRGSVDESCACWCADAQHGTSVS